MRKNAGKVKLAIPKMDNANPKFLQVHVMMANLAQMAIPM
jgi:hypothetical protein